MACTVGYVGINFTGHKQEYTWYIIMIIHAQQWCCNGNL